jgi:hypothetical protein
MGILRELIGLSLIFAAWTNPLGVDILIRILMFILGFDLMSLIPKIGIFLADFLGLFGFFGLGWTLMLLLVVEIVATFLLISLVVNLIAKPIAVFVAAFFSLGVLKPALLIAVIDFILNLTRKYNL